MNKAVSTPPWWLVELSHIPIEIVNNELFLFWKRLMDIIDKHGFDEKGNPIPLKVYFTPAVSENIHRVQDAFEKTIQQQDYRGTYLYSYPTKPNHYVHIAKKIFSSKWVHIESSSAFDINLAEYLEKTWVISKNTFVIHNGIKTPEYLEGIQRLQRNGFTNSVCVLDSIEELWELERYIDWAYPIGIRIATTEKGTLTKNSRLGIPEEYILPFIKEKVMNHPNFSLTMMHFFMNKWIKDSQEYYGSLRKKVELYCEAKVLCPTLKQFNIGWGMPISYEKGKEIDHANIIKNIVRTIKEVCDEKNTPHPDIISEFGTYTVAETGYNIYPIVRKKDIGNGEKTVTINWSFANDTPDVLLLWQKFPVYPINNLQRPQEEVFIDGLTCDTADIYPEKVSLPIFKNWELQWILVAKTGAYNDNISWWNSANGQLAHCQLQSPKTVFYGDRWEVLEVMWMSHEQDTAAKLKLLGAKS